MIILSINNSVNLWEILSAIGTLGAVFIALFFQFFENHKKKKEMQRMIEAIRIELEENIKVLKWGKSIKDNTHNAYSKEFFKKINLDTWFGYKNQINMNDIEKYKTYNQINKNLEFVLKIENVYLSSFDPIIDGDVDDAVRNVIEFYDSLK